MFKSTKVKLLLVAIAGAIAAGAVLYAWGSFKTESNKTAGQSFKTINSTQLADKLKQKDFILVNVHVPYEGEIEQTDAFILYNAIQADSAGLPVDKSAKIVVYCRTGRMSRIAAEKLISLGYNNVYDVSGGMEAWQAAGYPLIQKGRET